ncbi:hypothetical protein ACFX2A_019914 [Malus domestica]
MKTTESPATSILWLTNLLQPVVSKCRLGVPLYMCRNSQTTPWRSVRKSAWIGGSAWKLSGGKMVSAQNFGTENPPPL